jgi:hypothetical protein
MTSIIQVMKMVQPPDDPRPYRLVETFVTSEGMRSRICSGTFDTFERADGRRKELEAAIAETNQ